MKKIILLFCAVFLTQIFANQTCKADKIINLNEIFGKSCKINDENETKFSSDNENLNTKISKTDEKISFKDINKAISKTDKNDLLD